MIIKYEKYIKENKEEGYFFQTYKATKDWLDFYKIKDYTINKDLTVDVDGNVYLNKKNLLRFYVKFNIVNGLFDCIDNDLTSLKGSPEKCTDFYCYSNKLINLKYCPKEIKDEFISMDNPLININDLNSKNFIRSFGDITDIDRNYKNKNIDKTIYDNYFEYWYEKDYNIVKFMKDKNLISDTIKNKYSYLFNAERFDLI
jgi:hypothetical protein